MRSKENIKNNTPLLFEVEDPACGEKGYGDESGKCTQKNNS